MRNIKARALRPGNARMINSMIAILVLLIVLALNLTLYFSVEKFGLKKDLTSQQLFEITDETKSVIGGLKDNIEILYLSSESNADTNVNEVLKRYDILSDKVSLSYVSLTENPSLSSKYEEKGTPISESGIIVRSGSKEKILAASDMYTIDYTNAENPTVKYFIAEQKLTSAIISVTGENYLMAFTQGHDEEIVPSFEQFVATSNFDTSYLTLSVQDIPDDLKMIIIASPTRDFVSEEIKKLDKFLSNGGSIIAFLPPSNNHLTNLESLLEEWGIVPSDNVVFEPKMQYGSAINIVPMYSSHLINDYFGSNSVFMILPQTRSINTVKKEGKTVSAVLISTADAYGKTGMQFSTTEKESGDAAGPFALAVTSESQNSGRIFAAGSKEMYSEELLQTTSFSNGEFLVQVMNWCVPEINTVNVAAKSLSAGSLQITSATALILSGVFIIILPAIVLVLGIVVFLRRRYL